MTNAWGNEIKKLTESLLEFRLNDGGFPYRRGNASSGEPTIFATAAFWASDMSLPETEKTLAWLLASVNPDGSIGMSPTLKTEGIWMSPHFAILMHHLAKLPERDRAIKFILEFKSETYEQKEDIDQDNSLIGWPWVNGTFGWVEPTAWALIALNIFGLENHPRCIEARKLILDRRIAGGGWNYGNRYVCHSDLLPFRDTTALALLALRGFVEENLLKSSIEILEKESSDLEALYSLAWSVICLDVFGKDVSKLQERLYDMLSLPRGEDFNLAHFALGIIALSDKRVFSK